MVSLSNHAISAVSAVNVAFFTGSEGGHYAGPVEAGFYVQSTHTPAVTRSGCEAHTVPPL